MGLSDRDTSDTQGLFFIGNETIDWVALERVIHSHYAPVLDAAGRPAD